MSSSKRTNKGRFGEEGAGELNELALASLAAYPAPSASANLRCPSEPSPSRSECVAYPSPSASIPGMPPSAYSRSLSYSSSLSPLNAQSVPPMSSLSRSESERPYVYPTLSDSLSADSYKLQQWLSEHSLQHIFPDIQRLGYDSIDLFVECDDDNICQIDDDIRRNTPLSIPERLKFKKAIRTLKNARKGHSSRHQRDRRPMPSAVPISEANVRLSASMDAVTQMLDTFEQQQQSQEHVIASKFSVLFQQLQQHQEAVLKSLRSECQQQKAPLQGVMSRLQRMRDEASNSRSRVMDVRSISRVEREIAGLSESSAPSMDPLPSMAIRVDFTTDEAGVVVSALGGGVDDSEARQ